MYCSAGYFNNGRLLFNANDQHQDYYFLKRKAYSCLAALFLVLGVIGIFFPVMPTTPFILVAAWAASKGSPKIHAWLYNHPQFSPILNTWNTRGAVPRRAKWLAAFMMTMSWLFMLFIGMPWWVPGIMATIFIAVLAFIFTRPDA